MAIVGRACSRVVAIVALGLVEVTSPAKGQAETVGQVAAGTFACPEREAAADVMNIVRDIEAEDDPWRRLMLFLSSGECSDRLVGERYEAVSAEETGIVKARVRGLNVYLVPLTVGK